MEKHIETKKLIVLILLDLIKHSYMIIYLRWQQYINVLFVD